MTQSTQSLYFSLTGNGYVAERHGCGNLLQAERNPLAPWNAVMWSLFVGFSAIAAAATSASVQAALTAFH